MPKYGFGWWAGLSGEYVVEAPDRDTAVGLWNEVTVAQIIAQSYEVQDFDSDGLTSWE